MLATPLVGIIGHRSAQRVERDLIAGQGAARRDEEGDVYEEILEQRGILFESSAVKRFPFWAHLDCRIRITGDHLIFEDFQDDAYSFTIPMEELERAEIQKPRGWLSTSDDMLIILADGTEYEIGLEDGVKQKVLEIVRAIWDRYHSEERR